MIEQLTPLLQCLMIAAAISIALGVWSFVRAAKYERRPDVQFFVDRDPRWGYRR